MADKDHACGREHRLGWLRFLMASTDTADPAPTYMRNILALDGGCRRVIGGDEGRDAGRRLIRVPHTKKSGLAMGAIWKSAIYLIFVRKTF